MPVSSAATPAPRWAWAARHMPLVRQSASEVTGALAGRTVGVCLHLEPKTAIGQRAATRMVDLLTAGAVA